MSFAEVIGQQRPIRMLQQAIGSDRLSHAYLFAGPDSTGKRLTAKNFAKALNCEDIQNGKNPADCCDKCPSCKKIDSLNHVDIVWLEPETKIGSIKIDGVRGLQSTICLKPYEAKYKVYVILESDMLTEEASNALLKTLEEPPRNSILVLTTSNANRLLDTIISRCQMVKFSPLGFDDRMEVLNKSFDLDKSQAVYLSRVSESGLTNEFVQQTDILGYKNSIIDEFESCLEDAGKETRLYSETKPTVQMALVILLWWFRDILIYRQTRDAAFTANADRAKDLAMRTKRYSDALLSNIVRHIADAQNLIRRNANPKLVLSELIIKCID